jgi:hypothetical protein
MNRSHTGQTKEGDTFEKFLGPKQYDEYLLDFEKFLHASFCKLWVIFLWLAKLTSRIAKEDCESRRILPSETETVDSSGNAQVEEESEDDKGKAASSTTIRSDYEMRKEKEYKRAQNGTRSGKGNVPDARRTQAEPDKEAEVEEETTSGERSSG